VAAHGVNLSAAINAPAHQIVKAFFEADALTAWWQAVRSVTTPRLLGPYVIEWAPTEFRDDVLGRLGGVFRGTVMQFDADTGFFVADAFWLPPDGPPIGPMALEVSCRPRPDGGTDLRITQSGFEESPRWRRYYDVIGFGLERAINSMRMLLEK
jgi:hypothetical protein